MPLVIETTRFSGQLLAAAIKQFGISPDRVAFHYSASNLADDYSRPPLGILIQPGGLQALRQLKMPVSDLEKAGFFMARCLWLDSSERPLMALNSGELSSFQWLWVQTSFLRDWLAKTADEPQRVQQAQGCGTEKHVWKRFDCPGTLLRLIRGRLKDVEQGMFWDHEQARVIIGQASPEQILCYAIPRKRQEEASERAAAAAALDELPGRLKGYFSQLDSASVAEQWFAVGWIGYRSCWDGRVLQWGGCVLRLHPLTGQTFSYWAIQARQLASALARYETLPESFFQKLDRSNRHMFFRHLQMFQCHLHPTVFWQLLNSLYLTGIRHSRAFRIGSLRRTVLLDCPGLIADAACL